MKIDGETVSKVLALFDDEDIYYIHSDKLDIINKEKEIDKPKVIVRGGKDDRPGKQH